MDSKIQFSCVLNGNSHNITDRAGAILMFKAAKDNLTNVQNVLVDGGYTGENFANKVNQILNAN